MRPINGTWTAKPGNFDPLHALELFASDNAWGLPALAPFQLDADPAWTMAYDDWRTLIKNKNKPKPDGLGIVHFFTDDYRFESCWNNPARALKNLEGCDIVLSPDFSLFRDHPPAIWLWNIYRSRWLGAYWQSQGLKVIPTVSWSEPHSFDWCFLGLPQHATLAVATVGSSVDKRAQELFRLGYQAMCEQLEPARVICYSERFPDELTQLAPVQVVPPYQMKLRTIIPKAPASWEHR